MNKSEQANHAFLQVHSFLERLHAAGVKHIIISPGSRSTPLTLAAASLSKLKKTVILDERAAGFTALGIGKAARNPAALICTSGTAAANYFPAVIEARKSGVPMLLLTADRPTHLYHKGANQTINQQYLFGEYPVFFQNISESGLYEESDNDIRNLAGKAVFMAHQRQGPAHLNFPFRKPLEPTNEIILSVHKELQKNTQDPGVNFYSFKKTVQCFDCNTLNAINQAKRPLIIIGQLAVKAKLKPIFQLAEQIGVPVLSEQGNINKNNTIQGFEGFLRRDENRSGLQPDLILRFGKQPASKSLLTAIEGWNPVQHIYFSDTGQFSDISHTTTDFIEWNGSDFKTSGVSCKALPHWLESWKRIENQYFQQLARLLDQQSPLTDGHIYHHFAHKIPEEWTISFSNSFPARDCSMFGCWNNQRIFMNRGVSGIDGITSTAMGVNIGSNRPGILFTGDLAFLHDAGALLNHHRIPGPLVVVVINNQGGSIFRMLPVSNYHQYFKTYFETPQEADPEKIAASYGVNSLKLETVNQLARLNLEDIISTGKQKLFVIECKTNPEASMQIRKKLWTAKYVFNN